MTGADLLVVIISFDSGATEPTITDSTGSNTWRTGLTVYASGGGNSIHIVYAWNAAVSATQTFTATGTGDFPGICAAGFSGSRVVADPSDVKNGNGVTANTSGTTGSITPKANSELIVTGCSIGGGITDTASANSGFTTQLQQAGTANAYGCNLAYKVKTDLTAENVTWSWTNSGNGAFGIVSFGATDSSDEWLAYKQSFRSKDVKNVSY